MSLQKLSRDFLVYFFCVGHSSFDPEVSAKRSVASVLRAYFPSLCLLVLGCCCTILSFRNAYFVNVTFDSAIYCLMVASSSLTCALRLWQTPICGDRSSIIWTEFGRFELFAENALRMKFRYGDFRKSYKAKVRTVLFFFVLTMVAKFATRTTIRSLVRHVAVLTLNLSANISIVEIVFYVHLLEYMQSVVHKHIVIGLRDAFAESFSIEHTNSLATLLRSCKRVHFKLWEISDLISKRYGWLLVSLIVFNINYTVHPIYQFLVNQQENEFVFKSSSKYWLLSVFILFTYLDLFIISVRWEA